MSMTTGTTEGGRGRSPDLIRWTGVLLTLTLSLWLMAPAQAQGQPTITMQGTGEVPVTPDIAELSVGFAERGWDIAALEKVLDEQVTALVEALLALGIESDSINTAHLSINPASRYDQNTRQVVQEGYDVSRNVTFTVHAIDQLGAALSAVTAQKVTQVSPPRLLASGHETAYWEALSLAVTQARERATAVAAAGGFQLGDIVRVNPTATLSRPMAEGRMALASADSGTYSPGEMVVGAQLTVTFSIIHPAEIAD
jgi:uncharacterized protein YggE